MSLSGCNHPPPVLLSSPIFHCPLDLAEALSHSPSLNLCPIPFSLPLSLSLPPRFKFCMSVCPRIQLPTLSTGSRHDSNMK